MRSSMRSTDVVSVGPWSVLSGASDAAAGWPSALQCGASSVASARAKVAPSHPVEAAQDCDAAIHFDPGAQQQNRAFEGRQSESGG